MALVADPPHTVAASAGHAASSYRPNDSQRRSTTGPTPITHHGTRNSPMRVPLRVGTRPNEATRVPLVPALVPAGAAGSPDQVLGLLAR
jgi:hypothetical protein